MIVCGWCKYWSRNYVRNKLNEYIDFLNKLHKDEIDRFEEQTEIGICLLFSVVNDGGDAEWTEVSEKEKSILQVYGWEAFCWIETYSNFACNQGLLI